VIATSHLGEAAYYEQLRAMINVLESVGAVVCYESNAAALKAKAEQEWAAASDEERGAWDGQARMRPEFRQAACRYLGWVDQWTTLGNPPTWRYQDGSSLEYVRRAGAQDLMRRQRALGDPFRRLTQEQQEALVGAAWAFSIRLDRFAWWPHLLRLLMRLAGGVVASAARTDDPQIRDRNRRVLASLPTDLDAVLPWGASHLPGLARGLRKAGYRRRDTTWVTVGRLPTIRQTVKDSWPGLRAIWAATDAASDDTPPPSQPDISA
jgi:hypothetical protein